MSHHPRPLPGAPREHSGVMSIQSGTIWRNASFAGARVWGFGGLLGQVGELKFPPKKFFTLQETNITYSPLKVAGSRMIFLFVDGGIWTRDVRLSTAWHQLRGVKVRFQSQNARQDAPSCTDCSDSRTWF